MHVRNPNAVDFTSNDYLGMARWKRIGVMDINGSGGSRLLSGNTDTHMAFEAWCADFFRGASALHYSSGYMANLGLLSCLARRQDTYLYDERCHASIKDGMRLSPAKRYSFRHNDPDDLRRLLAKTQGNRFIIAESLYSMDGDLADVAELCEVAETHGAWLVLDEAHSTGMYGPGGRGLAVAEGQESRILARIHTFGKAVGRHGAVVIGPESLKQYLYNRSRTFIYTTAPPEYTVSELQYAIKEVGKRDEDRKRVLDLRRKLEAGLGDIPNLAVPRSESPILPLIVPGNARVRQLAKLLQEDGLDVRPILSPTVPEQTERLRIVLHRFNTEAQVTQLAEAIRRYLPEVLSG